MMIETKVPVDRILLTRLKFIGDVVLTTPLIRTLRETYPHASISYLGERHAVSLLEHHPMLDEVIPVDLKNQTTGSQIALYRKLFTAGFDVTIDLFSNPRSALMCFATRAPVRVGADRRGRGMLYTKRIKDDGVPKSAIEFHYQSLAALGIMPRAYKTELFLTDEERGYAADYLRARGAVSSQKIVALQCGGTWPAKLWDKDRFAELGRLCRKEFGAAVLLTGGMNDREIVGHVKAQIPDAIEAVGLPLRQVAALLSRSAAMVSNDCGAMHIAVAVDTPTIGIFGPGEEEIWFPYTKRYYGDASPHRALRKDVPCHPCHLDYCTREGEGYMECMRLLRTDEVFEALKEIV